ncbi:electron transport complex subunit RsxC [Telmatospirillum siberiense]|uniref:Ion-translocating oxidoreductase complex subunit C n=1 Tax=Telmatospirillum siberiense TaxID=382514 RepID=A0A2N3PMU1_9PROT|nr:electron transport complex subunit RsxC [Telmatospirillum siberiense]PKU21714.1 electron transport complex subunit RsxC [Telmatospirillum siberiense]
MRLFPIRGGIHPKYRKELTSEQPIVALPMPARLYLPLQQHIGAPAEPVVSVGQKVRKGDLLARGQGAVSAPTHASTSGVVVEITTVTAPHPSGLPQLTIILEPDGKDEWTDLPDPIEDPFSLSGDAIRERVASSGIVGLGGATFPAAVKLNLGSQQKIETLLINGAECEPYLTCDDRLMREYAAEIVDGARIMAHALGAPGIVIAIERNKPQALEAMRAAAAGFDAIEVIDVPVQYPMGSERHLTQAITGRETPAKKLTAELGVVVHNVGTARAVHQSVRFGRPLTRRVVTVSGGAVAQGKNIEVPLGAMVSELIAFCGGLREEPRRIVNGGPMMGQPLPSLEVPVVKGTSGILALTVAEANERPTQPCIRCGGCVTICPCGLVPVEMAAFIRKDNLDAAAGIGVTDCFSCGSCSYICPSHIPLVQYFNYAKGELAARDRERRRLDRVKTLSETRVERLERQAQAKREAAAAAAAARKAASVPSENKASQ